MTFVYFRRLSAEVITMAFAVLTATSVTEAQAPDVEPRSLIGPNREVWYGELHLHTSYSLDSYMMFGARIAPDEAYRFARGDVVRGIRRTSPPLDFVAVTDHAEWMGVMNTLEDPDSALSRSEIAKKVRHIAALSELGQWPTKPVPPPGVDIEAIGRTTWQRTIEAANRHYEPGKFTTFIAYEWTVNFNSGVASHLHRNVIFRGNKAPIPFSAIDSDKPEDLWSFLDTIRKQGHEALAIPHNPNISNGVTFDWVGSDGRAIDQAYAQQRATNEPLVEISQHKGTSETHPILSPNDEFADFELVTTLSDPHRKEGSYVRDALGRGLVLAQGAGGVNPFKYGIIGGSDFHTGLSETAENGFAGFAGLWGPIDLTKDALELERRVYRLTGQDARKVAAHMKFMDETSSGALTGVWAESNIRESIYDAFRRKETFATSGTRLKFRFFGGWTLDKGLLERRDWVKVAYAQGVPMGGDLPTRSNGKAPTFALWAVKDPDGANLDRLQVVKVSLKDGKHVEKVYDVALSDDRKLNPKTVKPPPVGNTVDVENATYTNSVGNVTLSALWCDPNFDPKGPAIYYMRVLEIPTPRWSTLVAARTGKTPPKPATIQERGWSSPIWYVPQ